MQELLKILPMVFLDVHCKSYLCYSTSNNTPSRQVFFGRAICKPFFILWSYVHYHSKLFQNLVKNFTPRQQQLYAALKHSSQQQPEWGAVDHRSQRGVGGVFSVLLLLCTGGVWLQWRHRGRASPYWWTAGQSELRGQRVKGWEWGVGRLSLILQRDSDDN